MELNQALWTFHHLVDIITVNNVPEKTYMIFNW